MPRNQGRRISVTATESRSPDTPEAANGTVQRKGLTCNEEVRLDLRPNASWVLPAYLIKFPSYKISVTLAIGRNEPARRACRADRTRGAGARGPCASSRSSHGQGDPVYVETDFLSCVCDEGPSPFQTRAHEGQTKWFRGRRGELGTRSQNPVCALRDENGKRVRTHFFYKQQRVDDWSILSRDHSASGRAIAHGHVSRRGASRIHIRTGGGLVCRRELSLTKKGRMMRRRSPASELSGLERSCVSWECSG